MGNAMRLVIRVIAMIVQSFFGAPQVAGIVQYLIGCIIKVFSITCRLSHPDQKRKGHKGIIGPNSIDMRP